MSGSKETRLAFLVFAVLSVILSGQVAAADVSPSMLKIEQFNAERGDAQSQFFMGEHYELGDSGISRNPATALQWYRKAAKQGHEAALYKIGLFHEKGYAGLGGGMNVALEWYRKAAAKGSEEARQRIDAEKEAERAAEAEKLKLQLKAQAEQQRQAELQQQQRKQERAKMLRANKPAMAGLPLKVSKPPAIHYSHDEMIEKLLGANWAAGGIPAEYLPAQDMSCVKSGEREMTCFSRSRKRVLGQRQLTFSVKSVLDGFASDGSFHARYFYNVTDIAEVPTPGPDSDFYGLRPLEGWQRPGLSAACRIAKAGSVACTGKDKVAVRFDVQ